jgi:hypothetical protein
MDPGWQELKKQFGSAKGRPKEMSAPDESTNVWFKPRPSPGLRVQKRDPANTGRTVDDRSLWPSLSSAGEFMPNV